MAHRRTGFRRVLAVTAPAIAALTGLGLAPSAGAQPVAATTPRGPVVVVSGLNNPRQIVLVQGQLMIVEAGRGGSTKITTPQGAQYVGHSGSVSLVRHPVTARNARPHRIIRGLLSAAGPDGSFAVGADGVAARRVDGAIYLPITYAPPDVLPKPLGTKQDGRLLRTHLHHPGLTAIANITGYERKHDPDRQGFDSNPYAALALPNGELVADAAGNDIVFVSLTHHVRLWHVFPNVRGGKCTGQFDPNKHFPGCNFVPTSLARDAAGHIFVSGLGSETPGAGRVVELSANGKHVLRTIKGFTAVTGVAVAPNGAVYVSQFEAKEAHPVNPQVAGVLTRVYRGHRSSIDVPFPAGIAAGRHGYVWVSAWSGSPATGLAGPSTSGQIWRLQY